MGMVSCSTGFSRPAQLQNPLWSDKRHRQPQSTASFQALESKHMLKQAVVKFTAAQLFLYQTCSLCPYIPFSSNAIPALTSIKTTFFSVHLLRALKSLESQDGVGTPQLCQVTLMHPNHHEPESVPLMGHRSAGALQEQSGTCQSTRVWLSKVKQATGSSRHSSFLKDKCCNSKYKKERATKQGNILLQSLESWSTL